MLSLILAWTLVGALALIGLTLALAPGRVVSRAPHCRKCKFNLAGVIDNPHLAQSDGPRRCPECGRDLAAKRAVRDGLRRRSRARLGFAAGLTLLALAGAAGMSWGAIAGFNWNRVKPVWLLEIEADSRNPASATPALKELTRRAGAGELSNARLARLARESLAIQADASAPWIDWRGDLIEHAAKAGLLTDEEIVEYAKQAMHFSLLSASRVHAKDRFTIRLGLRTERVANQSTGHIALHARLASLRVAGKDRLVPTTEMRASIGGFTAASGGDLYDISDLGPGVYEITGRARVRLYKGARGLPKGGVSVGPPRSLEDEPLAEWEEHLSSSFEVVPPDEPLVALRADPTLTPQLQDRLRVSKATVSADQRIVVNIASPRPVPVSVAFAIVVRESGREFTLRRGAAFRKNGAGGSGGSEILPDWFAADKVDVILRADAKVAREAGVLGDIWDGELVYENVPVLWHAPKPAPAGAADGPPNSNPD